LAGQFLNPEEARDIYHAATQAAPNQAYLYQQWAIFETTHPRGAVLEAERLAETAAVMEPGNNPFIHTQAEVARKRANIETSAVLKQQLRRQVRMFLNKLPKADRFTVSSRCKLMVDELADLSDELRDDERGSDDSFFVEKLRDTETMLMKAQQAFPDDAEMFEIEARLWSEMKNKTKALRALERAWRKMPRGSGTAIRIGKIYATAGRRSDELKVLTEALDRNPEDKAAHYAMAIHLLGDEQINNAGVIHHLESSVQTSDSNFEARFTLAQFLFATGDVDRAVDLFSDIDKRAPKEFRRFAPKVDNNITALLPTYRGTVESTRGNNLFIRSAAYPNRIFAHRSALEDEEADEMEVGQQVFFRLRFNRLGPVAVSLSVKAFVERLFGTTLARSSGLS
jgi:tetratricopeptide (TPR) repeat protein